MSLITDYDDLYVQMTPDLPGCPIPLVLQELRRAGRQFCIDTELLRETLTMSSVASQADYTLRPTIADEILRITSLKIDDTEVSDMDSYEFVSPETLRFETAPTASDTDDMSIEVALAPSLPTCYLPDDFLRRWTEPIVAGAKAALMLMPGKPWSNPQVGAVHRQAYQTGVFQARREVHAQHKGGSLRIRPVEFF